jgi:hypothetical protein
MDNNIRVAIYIIILILLVWFVVHKYATPEKMCGGYDQLCCCNGNETFTPVETLVTAVDPRMITDNVLSQVTMGV